MSDFLPAIDIAIKIDAALFLERMMRLGEQSGRFEIEHVVDTLSGRRMEVVNFRLGGESVHEGHGFQLIVRDEKPARVAVEMRAQRWSPEPPTRAVYEEAARELVGSLLKSYNRANGTRYRLRIGGSRNAAFRLSKNSRKLLDQFTVLANTSSLHPLDWKRFYRLVKEGRQNIPGHVLRAELVRAGFCEEKADELSAIYHHLWEYKRSV